MSTSPAVVEVDRGASRTTARIKEQEIRNADGIDDDDAGVDGDERPEVCARAAADVAAYEGAGNKAEKKPEARLEDVVWSPSLGKYGQADETHTQVHDLAGGTAPRSKPGAGKTDKCHLQGNRYVRQWDLEVGADRGEGGHEANLNERSRLQASRRRGEAGIQLPEIAFRSTADWLAEGMAGASRAMSREIAEASSPRLTTRSMKPCSSTFSAI